MELPFVINERALMFVLLGAVLILVILIIRMEIKFRRVLHGKNAKNLEDTIVYFGKELSGLREFENEMKQYLQNAERRIKQSTQGIHTVRFNPFKGIGGGGNQSFATAFINEYGNGVVLSSLYSRERMSMFAKPIKNYTSEFELTTEEKEAIQKAREAGIS